MNKYREKLTTQLRNIVDTGVGDYLWLMPDEAKALLHALQAEADAEACEQLLAAEIKRNPSCALKELLKE